MAERREYSNNTVKGGMNIFGDVYNQKLEVFPSYFKTFNYEAAKAINPPRVPNTCSWILNHPRFLDWRSNPDSCMLWVSADPGCGKSVLARALVDERLVLNETAAADTLVVHFFFKDVDEQSRSTTAMCCILHQILCEDAIWTRWSSRVEKLVKKQGQCMLTEFNQLWKLFVQIINDAGISQIVCVIDALDECCVEDRKDLVTCLNNLQMNQASTFQPPTRVKILATSRPYHDIECDFRGALQQFPHIRLSGEEESESISKEIDLVIEAKVTELVRDFDLSQDLTGLLKRKLIKVQQRTYLWLKFVLAELEVLVDMSKADIIRLVDELPTNVKGAYERILQRCPDKVLAKRLISFVVVAKRPLELIELENLAGTISEAHVLVRPDINALKRRIKYIRHICGLFLQVVDFKVYLIHQTAKEFLTDYDLPTSTTSTSEFLIDQNTAHSELGECCINAIITSPYTDENIQQTLASSSVDHRDCHHPMVPPHGLPFCVDFKWSMELFIPGGDLDITTNLDRWLHHLWSYSIIKYALIHWAEHVQHSGVEGVNSALGTISNRCWNRQILWLCSICFGTPCLFNPSRLFYGESLTEYWRLEGLLHMFIDAGDNDSGYIQEKFSLKQMNNSVKIMKRQVAFVGIEELVQRSRNETEARPSVMEFPPTIANPVFIRTMSELFPDHFKPNRPRS